VSKPCLNRADRDSGSFPPARASLPETMQEEMPADGVGLTGDFHGAFTIIPALVDGGDALATIETGFQSDSLELFKEVAVRFIVSVNE